MTVVNLDVRLVAGFLFCVCSVFVQPAFAQSGTANALDLEGKGSAARALLQTSIDSAVTPAVKAEAERTMAMSWPFEGNCAKTVEFEQKVIDYWATQETTQPGNAFYQQGEMANEGARVCIDSGDLDTAAKWYQKGHDLGLREPNISDDRKALWEFRLDHAWPGLQLGAAIARKRKSMLPQQNPPSKR